VLFSYFLFLQKESNKEKEPTGGRHFPAGGKCSHPPFGFTPYWGGPVHGVRLGVDVGAKHRFYKGEGDGFIKRG